MYLDKIDHIVPYNSILEKNVTINKNSTSVLGLSIFNKLLKNTANGGGFTLASVK